MRARVQFSDLGVGGFGLHGIGHPDGERHVREVAVGRWLLLVEVDAAIFVHVVQARIFQREHGVHQRPGQNRRHDTEDHQHHRDRILIAARANKRQRDGAEAGHRSDQDPGVGGAGLTFLFGEPLGALVILGPTDPPHPDQHDRRDNFSADQRE